MSLANAQIETLAAFLNEARERAVPIEQISKTHEGISIADGYAVQHALARLWTQSGARRIGYKAGLTSQAKMRQMGLSTPSFGILTSEMAIPENGSVALGRLIQPKVEAELAFVTGAELAGPDLSVAEILAATEFVIPALEIIDSRYVNFQFDLPSVIADNSSSAHYVTGGRAARPQALDLRTIGVVLERNGEVVAVGASAAVLNHPANAVRLLVRHLAELDLRLPAGSYVMTGSITEAITVAHGDVIAARFQGLGSISVRFS